MYKIPLFVFISLLINARAVDQTLCCSTTDYSTTNYLSCTNGKDYPTAPISSWSTCVSYQCIDWTVGSSANAAREADFLATTGQSVYFGVGSYSGVSNSGGLCYRIKTNSIDRDLIVQIVNSGTDVVSGNVDVQIGDGGFGLYSACTIDSTKMPQFDGLASVWGVLLLFQYQLSFSFHVL